jgi:hypothetical protein
MWNPGFNGDQHLLMISRENNKSAKSRLAG